MSKLKIFGIILIVILFMCISFLILKFSFKDMNKQNNKESITETTIDISDLTENNNEKVDTIITNQMEDTNKLTSRFKVLNKYSEKYVSVAEWMIQEICYSMHTNGFTVTIEDETLGWKTVDGLEVYENAEQYVTEYLNSDKDLDSLFQTYCNEYYEELSKYLY